MKKIFTHPKILTRLVTALMSLAVLVSCEEISVDPIDPAFTLNSSKSIGMNGLGCYSMDFGDDHNMRGLISEIITPEGKVRVFGRKRNSNGTYASQNHAALFYTHDPTGDDTDLFTTDWGNVLIINQDLTNVPDDNRWGGELILDFSAIGPVTMESLKALDIDSYENMSWVYLYNLAGIEIHRVHLEGLGDNSKQTVNLGNIKGVMMMKIVLNGRNESGDFAGSGAIDEIRFCKTMQTPSGCTRTLGYWKTHGNPVDKKKYNNTWDPYIDIPFFQSGMTYIQVLNESTIGNAYMILAHQYIAAELNSYNTTMPGYVETAFLNARAYFDKYAPTSVTLTPTRAEIIEWSEILDAYNNGKSIGGPKHCD